MNLVIDIGNSRTKVFIYNEDRLIAQTSYQSLAVHDLKKLFSKHTIQASLLSSVAGKKPVSLLF